MCDGPDLFLCILSILFPPIGVWVKRGICSADSLINLALCCLGYLPGLFHAWYIISLYPEATYEPIPQDSEGGRVTYYYIAQGRSDYGTLHPAPAGGQFPGQQSGTVNHFAPQGQPKNAPQAPTSQPGPQSQSQSQQPPAPAQPDEGSSSGGHEQAPPSYDETIAGDHKIQSRD